jgi:hypothetical protein
MYYCQSVGYLLKKKTLAVKLDKKYAEHFLIMDKVVCEEGIIINGVRYK